jgi:hypothetical protein
MSSLKEGAELQVTVTLGFEVTPHSIVSNSKQPAGEVHMLHVYVMQRSSNFCQWS